MTTLAGTSPMSAVAGTQCPNLPTGTVSADAYGDGCLAVNGIFGAAGRGGVQVDSFGNVFVADDINSIIHVIDPTTGVINKLTGVGAVCSGKVDAAGDGCVAATQTITKSPRGIGIDPYGNVLIAGYGDNLLHMVCRAASPLCTSAQVGTMQLVAGCAANSGSFGTGGVGSDNVKAAQVLTTGSCTAANGEVSQPRGTSGDIYGNIYFADTGTSRWRVVLGPLTSPYFSGNNPLYAALGAHYSSVTAGYAYTVANISGTGTSTGGTATTVGQACSETINGTTYSGSATDTYGDGCPLDFSSVAASSGYISGVAADAAGNMLFTDPTHGLRVFYVSGAGSAGALMTNAIKVNNPSVTNPQPGFIYMLWGTGATALGSTPTKGTSTAATDSTITKVTVSPQGNVFIGDSSKVIFYDMQTGYVRLLFASSSNVTAGNFCSGSSGAKSLSAYSDGCPAANSLFTNANGLGIAADGQDNLYLYDASSLAGGMLVRKVLAQGFAPETVGTAQTETIQAHFNESTAGTVSAPAATLTTTPDIAAGTLTCGAQNADNSVDCSVALTTTPSAAGPRSSTLSISLAFTPTSASPIISTLNVNVAAMATGSVLAIDSASSNGTPIAPTTNPIFSSITPAGVALDGAGNVYAMDSHAGQFLEYVQGVGASALPGSLPSNPGQIAVDTFGNVFAVGSGSSSITELAVSGPPASAGAPAAFTARYITYTPVSGTAAPQAIATDNQGNLFVADKQSTTSNTAIYRISAPAAARQQQVTIATGFANPLSLAVDASGNVYVADKDAGAVYKLKPGVGGYAQTTLLSGIAPIAVATDPAGDVYIQDANSLSVIEVPLSGPNTTVVTGLTAPVGVAVDGRGNLYSADSSATSVTQVVRNAVAFNFGTGSSGSPTFAATMTDIGNQSATGSNTVTNTTNFSVTGGAANGCSFTSSVLNSQAVGNACTLTANFVGAGTGTVSDVLTYLPAASTVGTLTLSGTLTGTAVATTTTITGPTPANPIYTSGTEATFTVTVTAASGSTAPGGTVAVTVDSTTTYPTLVANGTSGVATVTLTGLAAGNHNMSAVYATNGTFTGSNSGAPLAFSIAKATTVTTWTPATTSIQFSSSIGSSVLNATATSNGQPVAGTFVYTASGNEVNAGTYLPIGSYPLSVTFYPTDVADYATSTVSGGTLTVTQASTTAALGVTQNLVATDGTGNYNSIQAAINALPNSGGSIYIKPGTYTGFVTVVKPNVSVYGLGGDPTKVVLTNEQGAFSPPYLTGQGPGNNNHTGDEGSATVVVARDTLNGFTGTPSNFYAENLSIANTYDTDSVTTTTNALLGGTCTANQPAQTLAALYNAGTLCNSQALAIWITGDQAVLNNVYTSSLQDTIYAGAISGSSAYAARQYWFRGKVTGDVDYIFGDAAAAFDFTSIYTAWHGNSATGTTTIEAQNQADQTGGNPSYLSGYVMNSNVFTSQSTGMTNLYFGRPYGKYSTWIMLNSLVDQVNPLGYIEFSGQTNLPTSTYAEYNDKLYTDPVTGSPDANGVIYVGTGGNTGQGVTGTRETASQDPGTPMSSNTVKTSMTQAQAQPYYPATLLSATVPTSPYNTVTNWNPMAAIATGANRFVPTGASSTVQSGNAVTVLIRPQTPGLGAITNGSYTIPTGTYTLTDTYNGGTATLASGTLDAAGEAFYTSSSLGVGTHQLSWAYSGDTNFAASRTSSPYILNVAAPNAATPVVTVQQGANAVYGSPTSVTVTVAQTSGTTVPTGQVIISIDGSANQTGTLSPSGSYSFSISGFSAGTHSLTVTYGGDNNFAPETINSSLVIAKATLQVAANNYTIVAGQPAPTYAATIIGFVNGDTQASSVTGSPSLTTNPAQPTSVGEYPITATTGTLTSTNYTFAFTNGVLTVQAAGQGAAVATGDTRTITEPSFPSVCQTLTASILQVNDDIPTSVDATITNPDGARIQSALNACANTNQAVRLSMDGSGNNAFLSGPLTMPSGVTLFVDPGVVLFFSRNVQDYDTVPGTHTCGTVNNNSATSSCLPLININNVSNVGIMGFGKLDGRGGDTLLNPFPSAYAGYSWWGLSAAANGTGNQQNPRFIQISKSNNVTLYKITLRNSPLFHVAMNTVNGVTAWDVKIVTPTSSRNTDGIDPGNAQNVTVTRSWINDGDDNVALGASGSSTTFATHDISVTQNHMFAGHGESIGSYTQGGVNNALFDGNMLWGNSSVDSNSTGIRIKSANDRGGVVQNIQYSNSCFQNHKSELVFDPLYNTNTGTLTPNFRNILLQNLSFLTAGTVQLTGANNNGTTNPLVINFDNVSFTTLSTSNLNPAPSLTSMTYGPGQVSSSFVSAFAAYVGANGNTLADNRTASSLAPPACTFTAIAPELTGPAGASQTIISGQAATAVVILTPAVASSAYPTGTVTLSDGAGFSTTVTLTGSSDTLMVPLTGLSVGTHTFTATYSGDSNYVPSVSGQPYTTTSPYVINVVAGSLGSSTTTVSGVPAGSNYGNSFTATATVTGSTPTGTVSFVVNGAIYNTVAVGTNGTAQTSISLPVGSYSITAVYSGDGSNASSTSSAAPLTVAAGSTTTTLTTSSNTTSLGVPVTLQATVASNAGTPTGSVTFYYTSSTVTTPTAVSTATLNNGTASAAVDLPIGVDSVTAMYAGSGSFGQSSTASGIQITVNPPVIIPLPSGPQPLPYTISTIAGGGSSNTGCAGSTDSFGDGCRATSMLFSSTDDLRSVTADPFGNVYLTDSAAKMIRRISPNGVISLFAGYVSGTACVPTSTVGCTPSLVKLSSARGVASDAKGNIYIGGYSDNKVYVYKVATGLLYVLAGTGTKPSSPTASNGDGGPAASAQLNGPRSAWADPVGNVYIADTSDNKIRVVDTTGNIQTFAGTGVASSTGDGGPATSATISNPQGVLTDVNSNVYIADSSRIRVVCVTCLSGSPLYQLLGKLGIANPQNGYIYTIVGGGSTAYAGAPMLATSLSSMSPQKLAIDGYSNLYISDGSGTIWFLDARTGYIRAIAGHSTTACGTATNSIGDGCPATQAIIGNGGNGIGVGSDLLGNIYISDTLNERIRKVSTGLQSPATAVGSTATQSLNVHYIPGDSAAAATVASTEWALGTPACTMNADSTTDCLLSSAFTPAVPGARSTPLTLTSTGSNTSTVGLTGTGLGAGATLDPASQVTFGSGLQVAALATDNAGNVYVSDLASKNLLLYPVSAQSQGAAAAPTTLATLNSPGAVVADPRGYVYVADTATGLITQIAPGGATSTVAASFTTPAGLAVDGLNNLYVSDSATQTVYQLNPITGALRTLATGTPLVTPSGLSIDPAGNLLVADPGAGATYRINLQTLARTAVTTPATQPSAVLTDAAGNLLVADAGAIDAVPTSANSSAFTVASITPSALAIDAAGNLYTGANGAVLKLVRTQGYTQFAIGASPQSFTLLESGNQPLSVASVSQTDTTDYSLTAASSTDCTVASGTPTAVALGGTCALTATYTPTTYVTTTDTATFNGNLSNAALSTPSSVQLVLTGPTSAPSSSITLGAFSPASPVYGQNVTLSATVTGSTVAPAGAVTFTVDAATQTAAIVNGTATSTFSGLGAGDHSVSAAYASTNGYASASTSAVTLSIIRATPTVTTSGNSCVYNALACAGTATATGVLGEPLTPVALSYTGTGSTAFGPTPNAPVTAGTYAVTGSFAGSANYLPASSVAAILIQPAPTAVTNLTVTPSTQQYGHPVTISATTVSAPGIGGTVTFFINYGTSTQQQLGTTQTVGPNATATVSNIPLLEAVPGATKPGTHQITAIFVPADLADFTGNSASNTLSVTHKDSILTYAGQTAINTPSATINTATVPLTFTVQDGNAVSSHSKVYDPYPADIRNARFKILVNGNATSACSNLQPALIGSDTRVGSIGCNYAFTIPNGQTTIQPTITVVADTGSYYTASSGQTSMAISISLPSQNSTLTGSGSLTNASSAGTYAGDAGQTTAFNLNVSYSGGKANLSLQGTANILFRSNGRSYQIAATGLTSLAVTDTKQGNYGSFISNATLQDITNPQSPVLVDSNDSLTITFHDNGTGSSDTIGISLYHASALRFSSNWSGTATVEQSLAGGSLSAK